MATGGSQWGPWADCLDRWPPPCGMLALAGSGSLASECNNNVNNKSNSDNDSQHKINRNNCDYDRGREDVEGIVGLQSQDRTWTPLDSQVQSERLGRAQISRPRQSSVTLPPEETDCGQSDTVLEEQIRYQRLNDKLDSLANVYLSEKDKIDLLFYLNEFETNSCDLSELLGNLINNLLERLPNPVAKFKLLSLIRKLYVEPKFSHKDDHISLVPNRAESDHQGFEDNSETGAACNHRPTPNGLDLCSSHDESVTSGDEAFEPSPSQCSQLDLRLLEAMTLKYQLASNAFLLASLLGRNLRNLCAGEATSGRSLRSSSPVIRSQWTRGALVDRSATPNGLQNFIGWPSNGKIESIRLCRKKERVESSQEECAGSRQVFFTPTASETFLRLAANQRAQTKLRAANTTKTTAEPPTQPGYRLESQTLKLQDDLDPSLENPDRCLKQRLSLGGYAFAPPDVIDRGVAGATPASLKLARPPNWVPPRLRFRLPSPETRHWSSGEPQESRCVELYRAGSQFEPEGGVGSPGQPTYGHNRPGYPEAMIGLVRGQDPRSRSSRVAPGNPSASPWFVNYWRQVGGEATPPQELVPHPANGPTSSRAWNVFNSPRRVPSFLPPAREAEFGTKPEVALVWSGTSGRLRAAGSVPSLGRPASWLIDQHPDYHNCCDSWPGAESHCSPEVARRTPEGPDFECSACRALECPSLAVGRHLELAGASRAGPRREMERERERSHSSLSVPYRCSEARQADVQMGAAWPVVQACEQPMSAPEPEVAPWAPFAEPASVPSSPFAFSRRGQAAPSSTGRGGLSEAQVGGHWAQGNAYAAHAADARELAWRGRHLEQQTLQQHFRHHHQHYPHSSLRGPTSGRSHSETNIDNNNNNNNNNNSNINNATNHNNASHDDGPRRKQLTRRPFQLEDYEHSRRGPRHARSPRGQPEVAGLGNAPELLEDEEDSGAETAVLVPRQAKGKLSMSVAEQMQQQASNFVSHFGSSLAGDPGNSSNKQPARKTQGSTLSSTSGSARSSSGQRGRKVQIRRVLRVRIKKSKPILGIAIEGGFNVSGQLLPRIVCVHEDGAAYQCGKLRASDLILEVNGRSTVNMTHDEIAKTIASAYYSDDSSHIEFLVGESIPA